MSLATTINEMLTPNLLGGLSAKSGLPAPTVKRGIDGAVASLLDGLVGKSRDPQAMNQVAHLVAQAPDVDADRLLDDKSPIQDSGNALLGLVSHDSPSMVSRLARTLGVGVGAASGLLAAASSLAIGAFRKIGRASGGLTGPKLAGLLGGEREVMTAADTINMGRRGEIVEHTRRPWWLLALIPLALLGVWMWQRGRAERMVAPVVAPEVRTPAVHVPTIAPSVPAPSVPALSFPAGSVEANFLAHVKTPAGADEATWFELDAVEFDTGVATIRPNADEQVAHIAQILQANPAIKIKVGGYTDASGSREDNVQLSQARAESVRQALIAKGIDAARIETAGYGEHDKAVETEGATQANRRVAIRVLAR